MGKKNHYIHSWSKWAEYNMCGTETEWSSYMKSERSMVIVQDTCRKPDQMQQLESLKSYTGIQSGEKK